MAEYGEPWQARLDPNNYENVPIRDAERQPIGEVLLPITDAGPKADQEWCHARAKRIVACVNACAGLSDEQLQEIALGHAYLQYRGEGHVYDPKRLGTAIADSTPNPDGSHSVDVRIE